MKSKSTAICVVCLLLVASIPGTAECQGSIGGGIHYLRTLGSIKDSSEWDPDAVGFLVSYQYDLTIIKLEADLEWIPDFGGTDEALFQPHAWALVGDLIYAGAGIGIGYWDGDWQDNPFYALRVGAALKLGSLTIDGYTSYRFQTSKVFDEVDEDDLDALTFAALLRFDF